jgi:hypothetical protein
MDKIDEVRLRCFLSNSKRSLFELTKAISNPEKKAEKSNVKIISVKFPKTRLMNYLIDFRMQRYNILESYIDFC